MLNRLPALTAIALTLCASYALAGIIFVPVGGQYDHPELSPTRVQPVPGESGLIRIRTTGLRGIIQLDCSGLPGCQPDEVECAEIPFNQQLELVYDSEAGTVKGRTQAQLAIEGEVGFRGKLLGDATCLPAGGHACGQLVVDLEMKGVITDAENPTSVGLVRSQVLGSLARDEDGIRWSALASDTTMGFALPDDVAEILAASLCKG